MPRIGTLHCSAGLAYRLDHLPRVEARLRTNDDRLARRDRADLGLDLSNIPARRLLGSGLVSSYAWLSHGSPPRNALIEAIERALEGEAACEQVMHLIAGARGAMAGLMAEVVEDHVRRHLVDGTKYPGALNNDATEQLLEVVRTYLK